MTDVWREQEEEEEEKGKRCAYKNDDPRYLLSLWICSATAGRDGFREVCVCIYVYNCVCVGELGSVCFPSAATLSLV